MKIENVEMNINSEYNYQTVIVFHQGLFIPEARGQNTSPIPGLRYGIRSF